jgi:hypothetical protein
MVIIQHLLLLLEVLTERLIEVMLLASMNPLATVQITQSSMVGAEVVVVVLSTVVNTLVVVLITLVAGGSRYALKNDLSLCQAGSDHLMAVCRAVPCCTRCRML